MVKYDEKTLYLLKKLSSRFDKSESFEDVPSTMISSSMGPLTDFPIGFLFEPLIVKNDGRI